MTNSDKPGIAGALEDALARGMPLITRTREEIENGMAESIRDAESRYTPSTPARLKLGRPCKGIGPQRSRMKGVRLEVEFLQQLEARLARENLTFSALVQDLLDAWMQSA